MTFLSLGRRFLAGLLIVAAALLAGGSGRLLASCGPFTDVATGAATSPLGVCSDGVNFRIGLSGTNQIARF